MTFMILFDIFYIFKKSYTMSWYSFLECYSIQKTIKIILYKVYPLKATVGGVIRPQGVTIRNRGSATAGSATRGKMVYDMAPARVRQIRPQGVTIHSRGSATTWSATRGKMVYDMTPTVVRYFHNI